MNYFDYRFKTLCREIIDEGYDDSKYKVRPKWGDGESAHTKYITGVFNTYDVEKHGIPLCTLRPVAWKTAIKELLWIWQDKSNDVNLLKEKYGVHYWDSWVDDKGTLNKAYGYQLAKVIEFPEGKFDQVDRLLYLLEKDPMNRRIVTNMLNMDEMNEMTLAPCAYETQWSVRGEYLDMTLIQRSQDVLAANAINVFQYFVLLSMVAQVTGYKVGKFNHLINNAHIYDRHIDSVKELLSRGSFDPPKLEINKDVKDFYDFTIDDFKLIGYERWEQIKNIPIAE